METLTGTRDVDKLILLDLDDKSLSQVALVSTYVNSLMDESFWTSRFYNKYGVTLWKYGVSHRDIYREFSKLQDERLVMRAIDYDFIELIDMLLENNNIEKLLVYAEKTDHLKAFELLINKGAYIEVTPLLLEWAAIYGRLELIELLLDRGADIHALGDYALQEAAIYGHLDIVELLLDRGANIHADNDYALRWAANNGHLEVVKLLLDNGANIHAEDDYALRLAANNGHLKVIELLLNRGADIHANNDEAL